MHEDGCDLADVAEAWWEGMELKKHAEALQQEEAWVGAQDRQPSAPERGNSKLLGMTAKAAPTIAAMELFYTRTEPRCGSQGSWEALPLFRRKAHFYS